MKQGIGEYLKGKADGVQTEKPFRPSGRDTSRGNESAAFNLTNTHDGRDLFLQLGTALGDTIPLQAMNDAITRAGSVAGFEL